MPVTLLRRGCGRQSLVVRVVSTVPSTRPRPPATPGRRRRSKLATRAAPPGDEPTMVPVADGGLAGEEELFGPTAMLLCGLSPDETAAVRAMVVDDLGAADHVSVLTLTRGALAGTLRDALEGGSLSTDPAVVATAQRTVVLSGMYGGEVVDVIGAWRDAGLPEPVWCAAVPGNYTNRSIADLLEDVAADDAAMKARLAGGGE